MTSHRIAPATVHWNTVDKISDMQIERFKQANA